MKCPRCGGPARYVGKQEVPAKVRKEFKGKKWVRVWDCPKCGSFIDRRDS